MFPKLKKRIKSFILEEEGKIPKQSIIKVGSVLALAALGSAKHVFPQCGGPPGGGCNSCSCGTAEGGEGCGGCGGGCGGGCC